MPEFGCALVSSAQQDPAAILTISFALDPAGGLEAIEYAGDGGGSDPAQVGEASGSRSISRTVFAIVPSAIPRAT